MGMVIYMYNTYNTIPTARKSFPKLHQAMDGYSGKLDEGGTK